MPHFKRPQLARSPAPQTAERITISLEKTTIPLVSKVRQSELSEIESSDHQEAHQLCQQNSVAQHFYDDNKNRSAFLTIGLKTVQVQLEDPRYYNAQMRVCVTLMNYEVKHKDFTNNRDKTVNFRAEYHVQITPTFVENLANKTALLELYALENGNCKLVATGDLHLKTMLYLPQTRLTTMVDMFSTNFSNRAINRHIGQVTVKMRLWISRTNTDEDIFDSKTDLFNMADADTNKEFIEVQLPSAKSSKDSLFNVEIHDSSSINDFKDIHQAGKTPPKVPDFRRSIEEYAVLKGNTSALIKLCKLRQEQLVNVPVRSYSLANFKYKPELIIDISECVLLPEGFVMRSEDIKFLFVDYSFLSHEGPGMESRLKTKPRNLNVINFRHVKLFSINPVHNLKDCRTLAMLIRNNECLNIDLVNEPVEDKSQVQACQVVGTGAINLFELVQEEEDEISLKVPILTTYEKLHVGFFVVNVVGVQAMREVALHILRACNSLGSFDSNPTTKDQVVVKDNDSPRARLSALNRFQFEKDREGSLGGGSRQPSATFEKKDRKYLDQFLNSL